MPNPATVDDLEARWRPLTEQERTNADAFLEDAWALLVSLRPALDDTLTAGSVSEANVVRVLCSMVLRVLKNPEGKLEESIDDYRYRRDSLVASGALTVTDDELAAVTPLPVAGSRRQSVRLVVYGDS